MDERRDVSDQFIRELTACQNRLYAYILTLIPDAERARDVLQDTNVVLWRKAADYQLGTSFGAWACKVAYFEVLADRRRRRCDRHVFDEDLLEQLAGRAHVRLADIDERSQALDECLQKLPPHQRERLLERYRPGGSVQQIADNCGLTAGAVATALYRVRNALLDCIQQALARSTTR